MDRVSGWAVAHPWLSVALAAGAVTAAAAGTPRFHFETDLTKVFSRDVKSVAVMQRVGDELGMSSAPWLVLADDVEAARAVHTAFEASDDFGRVVSVASLLPADGEDRHARLQAADEAIDAQLRRYRGLSLLGGGLGGGGEGVKGPRSRSRRWPTPGTTDRRQPTACPRCSLTI